MLVAFATLAVAFVSSAYSGGAQEIIMQFKISQEVYTLGLSLFVLGFAIGPLLCECRSAGLLPSSLSLTND